MSQIMMNQESTKKVNNNDDKVKSNLTIENLNINIKQDLKPELSTNYLKPEPLLHGSKRYTILPIEHYDIWELYKKHEGAHWVAREVDLSKDKYDWQKLNDDEQKFIKMILAFFASSDLIVSENLANRFSQEIKYLEAQVFYQFQIAMENVHSEVYSNLINTYITNENEKNNLFKAIESIDCVKSKALWAMRWITSNESFAERLVAFAIVEGLFFSGAFCSIFWLAESGKMPGLCQANDFIARDEGLHTDFAVLLYTKYIVNKLSQERIEAIMNEALEIEINFITESLPCSLIGINANLMTEYIKFVADRLLVQLGHKPLNKNIVNPFSFMNRIALSNKSNFFEREPTEYQKNSKHQDDDGVFDDL